MKSNLVKQFVKPWLAGWKKVEATYKLSWWEEDPRHKPWRRSQTGKAWPEILPPQMDERYFNDLKLSIMEKIKAKRFEID
jgi:hypothetical protein